MKYGDTIQLAGFDLDDYHHQNHHYDHHHYDHHTNSNSKCPCSGRSRSNSWHHPSTWDPNYNPFHKQSHRIRIGNYYYHHLCHLCLPCHRSHHRNRRSIRNHHRSIHLCHPCHLCHHSRRHGKRNNLRNNEVLVVDNSCSLDSREKHHRVLGAGVGSRRASLVVVRRPVDVSDNNCSPCSTVTDHTAVDASAAYCRTALVDGGVVCRPAWPVDGRPVEDVSAVWDNSCSLCSTVKDHNLVVRGHTR